MLAALAAAGVAARWSTGPRDGVIRSAGRYSSPDRSHVLDVRVADDLVRYSVDGTGGGPPFSRHQRWFFFWDRAGNLWVHSSDVGSNVWAREGGSWTRHPFSAGGAILGTMPPEVRRNLPESSRQVAVP